MELKDTKHLSTSTEINVVSPSEKNNSESQGIYNLLFLPKEGEQDAPVDDKYSDKNQQNPKFGNVSTLDWLNTWRSTQIS